MSERELDVSDHPKLGVVPPALSIIQVPLPNDWWHRFLRWFQVQIRKVRRAYTDAW